MVSTDSPINGSATGPAGSGGAAPGSVYLAWQGACHFGWGIAGVQIALNWCRTRRFLPVLQSLEPEDLTLDPLRLRLLQPAIAASQQFAQKLAALPADAPSAIGMPVVFPLGNGAVIGAGELRGTRNIGRIVFENTQLDAAALARLRSLDALTVVSRWNRDLLAAQVDCPVVLNHEGIDPSVFFPGPRSGLADPSRFYIFSGGKVEYRKGHDLVLAAFRLFSAKHPEAMLVTAWQSPWPKMGAGLRAGLTARRVRRAPYSAPAGAVNSRLPAAAFSSSARPRCSCQASRPAMSPLRASARAPISSTCPASSSAGQGGRPGPLGSPLRANCTQ